MGRRQKPRSTGRRSTFAWPIIVFGVILVVAAILLLTRQRRAARQRIKIRPALSVSGHCFDCGGQAALVARGLVLVDDFFVGDDVYGADGALIYGLGRNLVAGFNHFPHAFNRAAQFGPQAGVVLPLLFALTRAFSG